MAGNSAREWRNVVSPEETNRPLHFFKMIVRSSIHDGKLMIPKKFVQMFGHGLSDTASFTLPNGCIWQMGLEKDHGKIWFSNGWNKFVDYYSIDHGSLLVFRYEGNSSFQVSIFNATTFEIEYPHDDLKDEKIEDQDEIEISDSVMSISSSQGYSNPELSIGEYKSEKFFDPKSEDLSESSREFSDAENRKECKRKQPMHGYGGGSKKVKVEEDVKMEDLDDPDESRQRSPSFNQNVMSNGYARAIRVAERFKTRSRYPSFVAVLNESNIQNFYIYVSSNFTTKYLSNKEEIIEIQAAPNKKKWEVRCFPTGSSMRRMGRGWRLFSRENKLNVGDVIVFELVKNSRRRVLKFTIFRSKNSSENSRESSDVETQKEYKGRQEMHGCVSKRKKCKVEEYVQMEDSEVMNEPRHKSPPSIKTATSDVCERELRAAERFETRNPSFTVTLRKPNIENYYMFIPSSFATKYLSSREEVIEVQAASTGKKWQIFCFYSRSSTKRMGKGWGIFCRENNLEIGDVVVFELVKNTRKRVLKFKILRSENSSESSDAETKKEYKGKQHMHGCASGRKKCTEKEYVKMEDSDVMNDPRQKPSSSTRTTTSDVCNKAIQAAKRFKTRNPSFTVILGKSNIERSYVYIPSTFVTKFLRSKNNLIEIWAASNGRKWKVQSYYSGGADSKRMGRGWAAFSKDNNLKIGDVIVFEFVNINNRNNNVLKFTLFPAKFV